MGPGVIKGMLSSEANGFNGAREERETAELPVSGPIPFRVAAGDRGGDALRGMGRVNSGPGSAMAPRFTWGGLPVMWRGIPVGAGSQALRGSTLGTGGAGAWGVGGERPGSSHPDSVGFPGRLEPRPWPVT